MPTGQALDGRTETTRSTDCGRAQEPPSRPCSATPVPRSPLTSANSGLAATTRGRKPSSASGDRYGPFVIAYLEAGPHGRLASQRGKGTPRCLTTRARILIGGVAARKRRLNRAAPLASLRLPHVTTGSKRS